MKKILFLISALFILIGSNSVSAVDFETVANTKPTGYVSDFANVLKDKDKIENTIAEIEKNTTTEIAVVIIDELPETYTIEDFAVELFEKWGIGKKEKDNGLLFLISINDRNFRIEVGYGLEGTITDLTAMDIAEKNFPPNFKNGNYDLGILNAIKDTKGFIEKDQIIIDEYANTNQNSNSNIIEGIISIIILLIVLSANFNTPISYILAHAFGSFLVIFAFGLPFLIIYLILVFIIGLIIFGPPSSGGGYSSNKSYSSSSSWGSSSSGGGFGGFGGGMSGGGGYSGGW